MPQKTCKICGETKDAKKDFYKSSGLVCSVCKNQQSMERSKEAKGLQINLLLEVRDNQRDIMERMGDIEEDLAKIRKALKKLLVN